MQHGRKQLPEGQGLDDFLVAYMQNLIRRAEDFSRLTHGEGPDDLHVLTAGKERIVLIPQQIQNLPQGDGASHFVVPHLGEGVPGSYHGRFVVS